MQSSTGILTVSGILIGFLFAGFWWSLNRELTFNPDQRHFKLGYAVLLVTMVLLGYFGMVDPLRKSARTHPTLIPSYRGVLLALLGILGYMLTELGHYQIFHWPRYTTMIERVCFGLTFAAMAGLGI